MTDYIHQVTIAVPENLIPQANQLALCLGESVGDDKTFCHCSFKDEFGNLYAVASTMVKAIFLQLADSPPIAPDHATHADLTLATMAYDAVAIGGRTTPSTIAVRVDMVPGLAILDMGLSPVPDDESTGT